MSAQFGIWNFDGSPPCTEYIERATGTLVPYGPDGQNSYSKGGVTIVYCAFHTTKESKVEGQPHRSRSGAVITWDGRLDNRTELREQLKPAPTSDCSDLVMVAAAYEQWGADCFSKLIGDWALSIWNPDKQSLTLAKDPIGTRHLYYSLDHDRVTWSSLLEPLVFCPDQSLKLSEEYIAGWLSFFPDPQLTPYTGIRAVPPSSFVAVARGTQKITKYWDFDPNKNIRYRTDEEYEEHFRSVFAESIRRRLRSNMPVLAELSGGMDSSSTVCMADAIIGRGEAETPRMDTVSYYDDSEPNWNERPFFSRVEARRGRVGWHIDVSSQEAFHFAVENHGFIATPACESRRTEAARQLHAHLTSQGYRVVLCGSGGDEVTGGVPSPIPELANLLARGRLLKLSSRLKTWSLNKRKPWIHLLIETVRCFLPPAVAPTTSAKRLAPWLNPKFVKQHRAALCGYEKKLTLFGSLPSFQENLNALEALRRQLACSEPARKPPYEKRYPYLDRGFLEFLFAIPREQLVRPGQRRSLMRRALFGIVPDEILNRRRKAFVARAPVIALASARSELIDMARNMISSSFGYINADSLSKVLHNDNGSDDFPVVLLHRTIALESWMRAFVGSHLCLQKEKCVPQPRRDLMEAPEMVPLENKPWE